VGTLLVGVLIVAVATSPAVAAGSAASARATVQVGPPLVRSVTVSAASFQYGHCTDILGRSTGSDLIAPSGRCTGGPVTVRVQGLPSRVLVSSTAVLPADSGATWSLCGPAPGVACTGPAGVPGTDQATAMITGPRPGSHSQALTTQPSCDRVLSPTCVAVAVGMSTAETFVLTGPTLSTDPSATRSHLVTWTALP